MGKLERAVIQSQVHPGMTVLDVGGNIGLYTLLFSQCVGDRGKVITLEPAPELHRSLSPQPAKEFHRKCGGLFLRRGLQRGECLS